MSLLPKLWYTISSVPINVKFFLKVDEPILWFTRKKARRATSYGIVENKVEELAPPNIKVYKCVDLKPCGSARGERGQNTPTKIPGWALARCRDVTNPASHLPTLPECGTVITSPGRTRRILCPPWLEPTGSRLAWASDPPWADGVLSPRGLPLRSHHGDRLTSGYGVRVWGHHWAMLP